MTSGTERQRVVITNEMLATAGIDPTAGVVKVRSGRHVWADIEFEARCVAHEVCADDTPAIWDEIVNPDGVQVFQRGGPGFVINAEGRIMAEM